MGGKVLSLIAGGIAGSCGMAAAMLSEEPPPPGPRWDWKGSLDADRLRSEREAWARQELLLRLQLDEARRANRHAVIPFASDGEPDRIPAPATPYPTRPEGE